MSKVTIEQWRNFVTVVDCGGFAQAGDALYKTQSTISHSIKKLEATLNKPVFDLSGRKAILTPFGSSLVDSARVLVSQADMLEKEAISLRHEVRNTVYIAVDTLFPREKCYQSLGLFSDVFPDLNIQIFETVLSRCSELLEDGLVDVGIAGSIPHGFITNLSLTVDLHAVAHSSHPLAQRDIIELDELESHRQIVVRDSGLRRNANSGWLGANTRTTVSSMHEAMCAVNAGLGFAWLPVWCSEPALFGTSHQLKALPLCHGQVRTVALQCGVRPDIANEKWLACLLSHLNAA